MGKSGVISWMLSTKVLEGSRSSEGGAVPKLSREA